MKGFRVLVAGCGSIGRRHIRNLASLGVEKFILVDPGEDALGAASAGLKRASLVRGFDDALRLDFDAAVVATPSSMHLDMARRIVEKGAAVLIEKPLSHTSEGVGEFASLARKSGVPVMVAMCYRFHPVLGRVKSVLEAGSLGRVYHVNYYGGHYLPDWHPGADYRREYAARADLGGGVVLTSIHGLDTVRWLFGEVAEHHAFTDRVSGLDMDVEDLALGIFRMESGAYVSWQTDFLQRKGQHRMVIAGELGTLRCDVIEGVIEVNLAGEEGWDVERIEYDVNSMYVAEMEHFLECVLAGRSPAPGIDDGIRTLDLALSIRKSGTMGDENEALCLTG